MDRSQISPRMQQDASVAGHGSTRTGVVDRARQAGSRTLRHTHRPEPVVLPRERKPQNPLLQSVRTLSEEQRRTMIDRLAAVAQVWISELSDLVLFDDAESLLAMVLIGDYAEARGLTMAEVLALVDDPAVAAREALDLLTASCEPAKPSYRSSYRSAS